MSLKTHLKELALLPAPAGYEYCAGKYLYEYYQGLTDNVWTDIAGNLIAKFSCGKENAKRAMVFAHMDSLGLIVQRIEKNGFLRVERLGGVPEKTLPALEVLVRTESGEWIPGTIGNKSHHMTDASEKYRVTPYQEAYIDLGADSAEEVRALGIEVGCPVVYLPRWQELKNNRCYGTTIDNRGGCAVIMEVAKMLREHPCENYDVYLVATVQEEYNLRGGMVAASAIKPDYAIAIDVALTGDTPDSEGKMPVKLGAGPAIGMYNFHGRGTLNGTIPHPALVEAAKAAAQKAGIPLQRYASVGILTDASYVQLVDNGTPVMDLAFPCRYTHTSTEVCSIQDLELLAKLVETVLRDMPADMVFARSYV